MQYDTLSILIVKSLTKDISILLIEILKISAVKCFSDLFRQFVVKIEVMNNRKSHSKSFLGLYKMSDIRSAVIPARGTTASFVKRSWILSILLVHNVHPSVPSEKITVPRIS